ncbi:hypothetical protein JI57_04045 [Psychromonas sp. PRT-SC03]|nr:hypothetical protein JI57_04045 [Psychromonas sp. PRT-SC03]
MLYKLKYFILLCSLLFVFSCESEINTSTDAPNTEKNLLLNSGFENWSNNTPDSWPIIDNGIELVQEKNIYKSGVSSVKIGILTDKQSNTYFRQSIDVIKGQSYKLSVWVYHSQGYVQARVFIDGYQNYSDNNS